MGTLLIQTRHWLGPARNAPAKIKESFKVIDDLETLATRLPLAEALRLLHEYDERFSWRNGGTGLAVVHTLIGVQHLAEELTDEDLGNARLFLVEGLADTIEQDEAA